MKKTIKSKSIILALSLLVVLTVSVAVDKGKSILTPLEAKVIVNPLTDFDIILNGNQIPLTKEYGFPEILNNRTMVPIRIISENMGYKVDWYNPTRKVTITSGNTKVEFNVGNAFAMVNGVKKPMDIQDGKPVNTKAYIKDTRTMVPLRFIAEAFGAEVGYERIDGRHRITINTNGVVVTPPTTGDKTYSGITFNPEKHTYTGKSNDPYDDGDGRMTEEKTVEFLEVMMRNVKFYTENGKYYVKYDEVKVPEGFVATVGISVYDKKGEGLFLSPDRTGIEYIPYGGSYVKELKKEIMQDALNITVSMGVQKIGYSGGNRATSMVYRIGYYTKTGFNDIERKSAKHTMPLPLPTDIFNSIFGGIVNHIPKPQK